MWVWALSFTVLGVIPEHGYLTKYQTRAECEASLIAMKREYLQKGKNIVGTCTMVLKNNSNPVDKKSK